MDPIEDIYVLIELDELYNDIQSELPGVEPTHGKRVTRQAVNRFLERSCVWRYPATPIIDEQGIAKLEAPACSLIVSYRDLAWCGPIEKRPIIKHTQTPYELQMAPLVPDFELGWLSVTYILKMARDGDKIPDYILDSHYEAMRVAALSRLMLEPSKPYTEATMGAVYARQASALTAEAKDVAERQYGREESKWRYPRWV